LKKNKFNMSHKHIWAKLLAVKDGKTIATSLFTCLKCGLLKIGKHTIRISKSRLDMGNLPIKGIKTGTFQQEYDNGSKTEAFIIDWANGQKQKVTISGTDLGITFANPPGPGNLILKIVQGTGGNNTLSWTTVPKWPCGSVPTLSTASGAVDIISFYWDGTYYYGVANTNFS